MKKISIFLIAILILSNCNKDDDDDNSSTAEYDPTTYILDIGTFPPPDLPTENELTVEGVKLGKMLFFETMLSKNNELACAGCHRQEHGFTDTARFSIGVEDMEGGRQAMTIFNMAWHSNEFFWDGRAHLLRDQSLLPIQDPLEMNETLDNAVAKLSATQMYKDQFTRAFGTDEITSEKMSLAMEQFMLSITSMDSKYDQSLAGSVTLTPSEERGRKLFFQEYNPFFPDDSGADCAHCHGGINFENDLYMNNGLDEEADIEDIGREKVTEDVADRAKFKVPSLRNIEVSGPYMHDGRFSTLEEVIDHYNNGLKTSNSLDPALAATMSTGLFLTSENKADLVNFLKTLTDDTFINNPEYADPFN